MLIERGKSCLRRRVAWLGQAGTPEFKELSKLIR